MKEVTGEPLQSNTRGCDWIKGAAENTGAGSEGRTDGTEQRHLPPVAQFKERAGRDKREQAMTDWGECALRRSGASHSRLIPGDEVKGPHLKLNAVVC